jgi:hypothetical protein
MNFAKSKFKSFEPSCVGMYSNLLGLSLGLLIVFITAETFKLAFGSLADSDLTSWFMFGKGVGVPLEALLDVEVWRDLAATGRTGATSSKKVSSGL